MIYCAGSEGLWETSHLPSSTNEVYRSAPLAERVIEIYEPGQLGGWARGGAGVGKEVRRH